LQNGEVYLCRYFAHSKFIEIRLFIMFKKILPLVACLVLLAQTAFAQQPVEKKDSAQVEGPTTLAPVQPVSDSILVTIILKHQQNKNLPEIRRVLEAQGFWEMFPPQDARVVSWTIAMGLGHVIILEIPAGAERRLNLALENGAWGAFDTEIYLTYDYKSVWEDYVERRAEAKEDRN
jgi:hypothetical protein